jgi:hypothetical protein
MYGNALKPVDRSWNFNGSKERESTFKPLCQRVEALFQLPSSRLPSSTQCSLLEATLLLVEKYKKVIDFEMNVDEPFWWVRPLKKDSEEIDD